MCSFFFEKFSKLFAVKSFFLFVIHAGFLLLSPQYVTFIQYNDHYALQADIAMK